MPMNKPSPSRVASRYSPAESAAISLLQDAPDESIEDLIGMVLESRGGLMDPVSRTFVDAREVADALRGMAPEPYTVPGGVAVYHATDASTARLLTRRGFIPQTKPRNLTDTYAPGRGIDRGLYVGATPRSVEGYGRVVLEATVPRKHLSVPTELAQLGETNPMKALKSHDGAVINHPIPAEAFRVVKGRLASASRVARVSPRIKEAIEESMLNLPENIHRDIESFAHLVLMGQAPSLEKHTSTLYKAFAPLRKALGGTTTMYRGQPIDPPKIERKWLSWTTEPRMAARFTGDQGDQIIEAKVKSSDVVAGILSPHNPGYIEFLVKNRPEYQTRSPKQVPIYYALYMESVDWGTPMPENYGDLSDREKLEWEYPGWKRWLKDNGKAVERAGGLVMHSDPPKRNPAEIGPFLGVLMPADVELPPALAALDDAKYGRPRPRYMGKVASAARVASRYAATTPLPPSFPDPEPGLMTREEFLTLRNPGEKYHEPSAYDYDLMKMNEDHSFHIHESKFDGYDLEENPKGTKITRDGKLVAVVHNGTMYLEDSSHKGKIVTRWRDRRGDEHDLGVKTYKKVKYLSEKMPLISPVARNNFASYPVLLQNLIVKGEPMTIRAEKTPGKNKGVNLAILNSKGLEVAVAQNEWGTSLLTVAREYRGLGLGRILGRKWYDLNPQWESGGFTPAGEATTLALWEDRVKEFMGRGWYSELIREGTLTHKQVKAILAGINQRPPRPKFDKPKKVQPTGDTLTYVDPENSNFIVYDRAFFADPDERFIHGFGFLRSQPRIGPYFFALDYDQPYADLVNRTGLQMARDGGDERLYDGDGYSDTLELNGLPGIERDGDHITITQDLLPGLAGLASKERRIRKEHDSYDEKFVLLQEQANSKWSRKGSAYPMKRAATRKISARSLMWHGTSARNLRSILKRGLAPTGTDAVYTDESSGRGRSWQTFGGLYFTKQFTKAHRHAEISAKGGHPLIVGVTYESKTPSVMPDEDEEISRVEHVIGGTQAADFIGRRGGFWSKHLVPFKWVDGAPMGAKSPTPTFDSRRYRELVRVVETADVATPVAGFVQHTAKRWPQILRRYKHNKKRADPAIAELIRAHTLHLLETDAAYQGLEIPPALVGTFPRLRKAMAVVSKLFPETTEQTNQRTTDTINYRGKNRILMVVEIVPGERDNLIFHYGANHWKTFTKGYFMVNSFDKVMDGAGRVLNTA